VKRFSPQKYVNMDAKCKKCYADLGSEGEGIFQKKFTRIKFDSKNPIVWGLIIFGNISFW
jgi:hypothetical protein